MACIASAPAAVESVQFATWFIGVVAGAGAGAVVGEPFAGNADDKNANGMLAVVVSSTTSWPLSAASCKVVKLWRSWHLAGVVCCATTTVAKSGSFGAAVEGNLHLFSVGSGGCNELVSSEGGAAFAAATALSSCRTGSSGARNTAASRGESWSTVHPDVRRFTAASSCHASCVQSTEEQ